MALTRSQTIALAAGGAFALAMPAVFLIGLGGERVEVNPIKAARAIVPPPVPPVAAIYERNLFAVTDAGSDAPADAPALVGIAGRLNRDAVALVRLADGSSRSLRVGESVDGWRLESLAIDAASFVRGRERVRVAMAGDETPPADVAAQ